MILRGMLFSAGLCLLGLIGVRSQQLTDFYSIYYIEIDYNHPHSTLYKTAADGSHRQKALERDSIMKIEDVSPRHDWLLLSMNDPNTGIQQIYRLRPLSGDLEILTPQPLYFNCARFSDDGQWILYEAAGNNETVELRRMRVNGTDDQFIIQSSLYSDCQQWSRHGDWLVVRQADVNNNGVIYRVSLAKADVELITSENETNPRLSPDGQWLASRNLEGVILRSLDGQTVYPIPESNGAEGQFLFSPDSKWLVLQFDHEATRRYQLKVVRLSDLNTQVITATMEGDAWLPAFLPDADWLIFMTNKDRNLDIYRVDYDGTNLAPIIVKGEDDWVAAVAPDNQHLVVGSIVNAQADYYLMATDGTEKKRLTNSVLQKQDAQFIPTIDLPWHAEILAGGAVLALLGAGWSIGRRWRS